MLKRTQCLPKRKLRELTCDGRLEDALANRRHTDPADDPVPRRCAVNLDSVESVSIGVLTERIGQLSSARMHELCSALAVAVDCA